MARVTEGNDARSRGGPSDLFASRCIYQSRIYWIDCGVSPETSSPRRRHQSLFSAPPDFYLCFIADERAILNL